MTGLVVEFWCTAFLNELRPWRSIIRIVLVFYYGSSFACLVLQNFQQQPSKQLLDMLKWLFDEVNEMHKAGIAHGSITLSSVMCHPEEGWKLVRPQQSADIDEHRKEDIVGVARAMCFMCLSSDHRRKYQPHHLAGLSNDELLGLVVNVPDVCMLASAMFSGRATLANALDFHLWHPLAVHAQVRLLSACMATHFHLPILFHCMPRGDDWCRSCLIPRL